MSLGQKTFSSLSTNGSKESRLDFQVFIPRVLRVFLIGASIALTAAGLVDCRGSNHSTARIRESITTQPANQRVTAGQDGRLRRGGDRKRSARRSVAGRKDGLLIVVFDESSNGGGRVVSRLVSRGTLQARISIDPSINTRACCDLRSTVWAPPRSQAPLLLPQRCGNS
jgi:hypothetical protein